jgi:hypothetical protein
MTRALLALLFCLSPALSQARTFVGTRAVELCFELQVEYRDGAVGDWTTGPAPNDTMIAHGVRVRLTNNRTGAQTYHWADVDTGCFTASLASADSFQVRVLSKAKVSGDNQVVVLHSHANPVNFGWTATSSLRPAFVFGPLTYTWPRVPGGSYTPEVTNLLAAGAWSVRRRWGGLSGQTLRMYKEACRKSDGSRSGSCLQRDDSDRLAISLSDSGGTKNKFQISHELGHLIAALRDESSSSNSSGYGLDCASRPAASACADGTASFAHHFYSEEWNTAAANEGMAHFYAAAAWNWPPERDCEWYSYYDGTVVDCENGSKYLANTCYGGAFPTLNSGNELDWMRFWWDVHSDCGVNFGPIMDIWDRANPRVWTDATVVTRLLDEAAGRLSGADYACFESKARFNGVTE